MTSPTNPSPAEVVAALQRGGIVEALKLVLAAKSAGVGAAKKRADRVGTPTEPFKPPPVSIARADLSPGEVPRSSGDIWLVLIVIAALCVGYYFAG